MGILPKVTASLTKTVKPTSTDKPTATIRPIHTKRPAATPLPTFTPTPFIIPSKTNAPTKVQGPKVIIVFVNYIDEYVNLKNIGNQPQDLTGWLLVSERGNQTCSLSGVIQPDEILTIYAQSGPDGISCGYIGYIWNNDEPDPAVLYNAQGQEVDRRE